MGKINQEEYELLKSLDDQWRWIVRDSRSYNSGNLFAYSIKPFKHDEGVWDYGGWHRPLDSHLFQFTQWDDEEPHNIQKLIEEYEFGKILLAMAEEEVVLEIESKNEEREDKKDIELLKEQIEIEIRMWDGAESGWAEYAVDKIFNLIDKFLLSDKGGNCDDKKD